ncbi:hypothetical protein LPW11_04215 [Geomonas sp. RF6]|uniref:hypothetical protein n=1 Tax=Geomonas sp. RF6 TaxID=2897342 RepID=UPI001E510DD4|nr:hypothetical protein [Geomonas sp. RF6]UFS71404.1 hypothetical protein LPW11_04215 [Geomonas sp. RF6]
MWISWKRYCVGALMLASLSLILSGCGDYGGSASTTAQPTPATKVISGFVSDVTTGLPVIGASVTAYAVNSAGVQETTPLSLAPESVLSGTNGSYTIKIPEAYAGSVIVEATITPATLVSKLARALALTTGTKIRSAVPGTVVSQPTLPPVMVSFATEAVVKFLEANVQGATVATGFTATGLSADNIEKATLVMETFFGQNFTQTPPPKNELEIASSTKAQQDLLVMTQALNSVATTSNVTMTDLVTSIATTGIGSAATAIQTAISTTVNVSLAGVVPPEYTTSQVITTAITSAATKPALPPDLTDTTAPTAPANLAANSTIATKVNLTWSASTDTALAGYTVYRSVAGAPFEAIDTVAKETTAYSDLTVAAQTSYLYRVVAFDASRNLSAPSNDASVVTPAATPVDPNPIPVVYSVTGKITANGVGLANVLLTISGSGTGTVVTGTDGTYNIPVLNGTCIITPSLSGYLFTPASKTVDVNGANVSGQDFTATGSGSGSVGTGYPSGTVTGGVTYPNGIVTGSVSYPVSTVIGGVTYPAGTIIGGISYPSGVVIGGVTYPTATVIGGVTYPTGTVIGGITYPNGVVIGGVTYPAGTIVGGVAFPVGAVTTGLTYPSGTVIGGVIYPTGTVTGGVIYPGGTLIGSVTYPTGTIIGGLTYPSGTVVGTLRYPTGTAIASVTYPSGSVVGSVTYPTGTIAGAVAYPSGSVTGALFFPLGETLLF